MVTVAAQLLLWRRFDPWLENFHIPWEWPKKKKKKISFLPQPPTLRGKHAQYKKPKTAKRLFNKKPKSWDTLLSDLLPKKQPLLAILVFSITFLNI